MKLFLILATASLVYARSLVESDKDCDGIYVHNIYHSKEVLKTGLDRPYLLSVDLSTNTVFFSYSIDKDEDEFKSAYLDLTTLEFNEIENVKNGFAQTVDQKTNDVYIGGSDGLYKFDQKTKKATFLGAKGKDIWMVYSNDVLYYSVFPKQFLFTYQNGKSARFKDLEDTKVDHLIIDNNDTIFFTNDTGLYSQKKGSKDAVFYAKNVAIRGLATDIDGNPYACISDGIYVINKDETKLEKIADIDDAFGLAFDSENDIIYADATSINKLTPSKRICDNEIKDSEEEENYSQ